MKKVGNTTSNRKFNPGNTKPPIPIDADEADSAMERFIRKKYSKAKDLDEPEERRAYSGTHRPSRRNSNSSDDNPPPLPPKQGSRFGFRSASSIFPMSSKSKREAAARAHLENEAREREREREQTRSPQSSDFGRSGRRRDTMEDMDSKLASLRDMGFTDEKKNKNILKSFNGNLEQSIETLVRLGGKTSGPSSRSRTPVSPGLGLGSGLTIDRSRPNASPAPSNDPWAITSAAPQTAQSTGNIPQNRNPGSPVADNNPFNRITHSAFGLQPSQSHTALNQQYQIAEQFQNLSVGPQQPLFPNHTGGAPSRQPYSQAAAPPLPSIPQGQYQDSVYSGGQPQSFTQQNQNFNPFQQQQQQQQPMQPVQENYATSSNPYAPQTQPSPFPMQTQVFSSQAVQQTQQSPFGQTSSPNPWQTTPSSQAQSNPFGYRNQAQQQLQQSPQVQPNNPYGLQQEQPPQFHQTPISPQQQSNPWATAQAQQQQYGQTQFQQQPQQLMPQQTGRPDKSSILALYNMPQLAPTPPPQAQAQPEQLNNPGNPFPSQSQTQNSFQPQQTQHTNGMAQYMGGLLPNGHGSGQLEAQQLNQQQPNNVSNPQQSYSDTTASRNPFISGPPQAQNGLGAGRGHLSQESMSVSAGGWGVQNGRHSPDAFASLSARSLR